MRTTGVYVGFEALMVVTMKITTFRDVTPGSLVYVTSEERPASNFKAEDSIRLFIL
jgi:hypothetical protein